MPFLEPEGVRVSLMWSSERQNANSSPAHFQSEITLYLLVSVRVCVRVCVWRRIFSWRLYLLASLPEWLFFLLFLAGAPFERSIRGSGFAF